MRMELHFIDRRLDAGIAQKQIHLGLGHVGRADMTHPATVDKLLHGPPGAHVALMDVGSGMGVAHADVAARRMMVGKRPVDEEKVQILQVQIVERLSAGADHILRRVHVVPELGGDP